MFTYDDKNYELKLNLKTVKQIEAVLGKGIMAALQETRGMLAINDLVVIAGYGMYNDEGNRIAPAQGMDIAEGFMTERGYAELVAMVVSVIERDCPFFFQVD